jgi:hypothetical protein
VGLKPSRAQVRRLREVYRSAGWPCQDTLELELLALGWLTRERDAEGRERLRLSDAGIAAAAVGLADNRARRDAHETLVRRTVDELLRAGRVAWTGLNLRAGLAPEGPASPAPAAAFPGLPLWDEALPVAAPRRRWVLCEPDVFSLRPSSRVDALDVAIHEIKVSRADLLGELRRPAKSAAYAALCAQAWFVLKAGIAELDEIPPGFGVWWAHPTHFELARAAPQRPHAPDLATWLALARARPCEPPSDGAQQRL